MDNDFHYYEPAKGHGLRHDPISAIIGPRPIGWISTTSTTGHRNLAPYSFFMLFNYRPPIIGFASTGWKDSTQNIQDTGEFVWSLAPRELAEPMNMTSQEVGPEVDEFELVGLTPEPSTLVKPARVGESPVAFECRRTNIVQLNTVEGTKLDSWLVLGEVIAVHIRKDLIRDGVYDTAAAHPILRAGGRGDYFEISDALKFFMPRPT